MYDKKCMQKKCMQKCIQKMYAKVQIIITRKATGSLAKDWQSSIQKLWMCQVDNSQTTYYQPVGLLLKDPHKTR